MDWIDRLNDHVTITKTEAAALTALTGLFLSGLLIQHVWESRATVPDDYYATTDSIFQARTAQLRADSAAQESSFAADTSDSVDEESSEDGQAVRMNLNAATARQLQQLSGIGPVLAGRIIAFRKAHGPFEAVDHLVRVSGIGPKTLSDIQPLLYVEDEDTPP